MKSITLRELKHDTATVLAWVEKGERVEIRREGKPVAIISSARRSRIVRPDFAARLKAIYGETAVEETGTAIVSAARGET